MKTFQRIIASGKDLTLNSKIIELKGHKLNIKQIETICSILGNRFHIAATPFSKESQAILINSKAFVPCQSIELKTDDNVKWEIGFKFGEDVQLKFKDVTYRQKLADLYFRQFLLNLASKDLYWRIGDSNRIFYELKPCRSSEGINAFRRFEIAQVINEDIGLGLNLHISTGFFSQENVEYYFQNELSDKFFQLIRGEQEVKGTLVFHGPTRITKCYFDKFSKDYICGTIPPFKVGEKYFKNLVAYYEKYDNYGVQHNDSVAYVSFKGLGIKPVPAKKLNIRIFNDSVPKDLKDIDKISPFERKKLANKFWNTVGEDTLGKNYNKFYSSRFYKPSNKISGILDIPELKFGKNNEGNHKVLYPPKRKHYKDYREYFYERKNVFDKYGCYYIPPIMENKIYFPYPKGISDEIIERVTSDICNKIALLTKNEIEPIWFDYDNYIQGACRLKEFDDTGMATFIFNNNKPSTYYNINYELNDWNIKRLTQLELVRKYRQLLKNEKGLKIWNSYIDMISYDIIQKMYCVPWIPNQNLNYDIHLAIDVSESFTHLVLSLMIFNKAMPYPIFRAKTERKSDDYSETINPVFLEDYITELFQKVQPFLGNFTPSSCLVIRDGKDCQEEFITIKNTISKLKVDGILSRNLEWDFVEFHKTTAKGLRLWKETNERAYNVLEGTFYYLDPSSKAVIAPTGAGTLTQGTAEPILVEKKYTNGNLRNIIEDLFVTAQLNYSNPMKAQKLGLPMKRADESLIEKRAQEIKGLRLT